MEEYRVLKSIYTQRAAQGDSVKKNRKPDRNGHEDEDDDQDRNPRHQYVSPTDVVHSIFGGKVSIESKRERKLLKRACLNVDSTDGLITDPKFPLVAERDLLQQAGPVGRYPRTRAFSSDPGPLHQQRQVRARACRRGQLH